MKIDSTNSKHGGLMNAKRPHSKIVRTREPFLSFFLSFWLREPLAFTLIKCLLVV
ncbi:hypothetical protein NC652_021219 [Populus alba x Populus x berolinensis]|nr:hypothetical protein NC652_021219 [Populus alba x Populus x berolinensis]